jgi:hypothetical protein
MLTPGPARWPSSMKVSGFGVGGDACKLPTSASAAPGGRGPEAALAVAECLSALNALEATGMLPAPPKRRQRAACARCEIVGPGSNVLRAPQALLEKGVADAIARFRADVRSLVQRRTAGRAAPGSAPRWRPRASSAGNAAADNGGNIETRPIVARTPNSAAQGMVRAKRRSSA